MYESELTDEQWNEKSAKLDESLKAENVRWNLNGFDPSMLLINAYLVQMRVALLMKIIRKLGISEAELECLFKETQLEQLQADRAMLMENKLNASPKMATMQSKLLGPTGRPLL